MRANKRTIGLSVALLLAALVALPFILRAKRPPFLAEADLGAGRILRIEAVTYGKHHPIGQESMVIRTLGPWLPRAVQEFFEPDDPYHEIERDEDRLVIWVNAIDAVTKTNVDCQGVRLDLIGRGGTIFSEEESHWFGGRKFWRVGHIYGAFPRNSQTLTLRLTSWQGTNSAEVQLPNPAWSAGAAWTGRPLPQTQTVGASEILLTKLNVSTNESTYWKAGSPYWKPDFEIHWKGIKQTSGWDLEWLAEDRYGNRGQQLGVEESVLKFEAKFFPSATNLEAAVLITNLAPVSLPDTNRIEWHAFVPVRSNSVTVLGFFPAGVHTFRDGEYLTNPPVKFAPVGGGAPSGWVSQSRRVSPSRTESFHGHYSDVPVIFLRVSNPQSKERIGMRLVATNGIVYLAEPEPQGAAQGIYPFLLRAPADLTDVRPELVFLPAFESRHLVNTRELNSRGP